MTPSDEEAPLISHSCRHENTPFKMNTESHSDAKNVLYWSYLLLGFGLLTPWSSFLAAVDYIEFVYPDRDAMRWLTVLFYPPMLLSLILNSSIPFKIQGHNRIALGFLGFSLFLASVPTMDFLFISDNRGSDSTFVMLLLSGACIGFSNGLVEGSVLGLTLFLPSQYYQAYTSGGGAAAIFVTLLRILCKAALEDSPDGLRISACIFFMTSSFLCFSCFLVQRCIITSHPMFRDLAHSISSNDDDDDDVHDNHINFSDEVDSSIPNLSRLFSYLHISVIKKLHVSLVALVFIYFTTTVMFPGVPSDAENEALGDWYKILLVMIFSIGDFISRLMPRPYICTSGFRFGMAAALRGLFIPIVFFSTRYLTHPIFLSTLMLLLGLTNGYATLCAFALGHKSMDTVEESFIGGNLLIIALILGINLGSAGSLGWARLVS